MRAATTALAVIGCALGCIDTTDTLHAVRARVGPDGTLASERDAAPRKLGTRTRNAIATGAFEIPVPPGADVLAWSTACAAKPQDASARAAFRIEGRDTAGSWEPLSATRASGADGWRDHELPLDPHTRALRFAIDPAPGCEALWGSPLLLGPGPDPAPRPNVVLISLDTLGAASLGSFSGEPGVSPHLDAFLDEGASFRRAYAQYGNTLVSHSSLFSGLVPRRHGVYPDIVPGALRTSLVRTFSDAGYRTVAFTEGAFVSAAFGFAVGFDAYDDGSTGLQEQMAGGAAETFERAARFVEGAGRRDRFFLFLHTYEVHAPYLPRDDEARRVADRLTPGDDRVLPRELQGLSLLRHNSGARSLPERDLARLEALHLGEVHGLDRVLETFLARLRKAGLDTETLVVVTSDHGDQFGEDGKVGHGDSLHNRVLHVPLGFRWPGVIPRRRIEAPVQLVDVLPTLLDFASLPVPEDLDGTSLAPALGGGHDAPQRPAYSEQRSARGECARLELPNGCRLDRIAVQSGRFKLVESALPPWQRLYDLESDPEERRDVAGEHPDAVAHLASLLERYREAPPAAATGGAPRVDAETLRRLRDLGYAEPAQGF